MWGRRVRTVRTVREGTWMGTRVGQVRRRKRKTRRKTRARRRKTMRFMGGVKTVTMRVTENRAQRGIGKGVGIAGEVATRAAAAAGLSTPAAGL
jgi:hypothetical protein